MKLSLKDINAVWTILYNKSIQLGIDDVETENDYYWTINSDYRTDFGTDLPKICVGSIIDDWEGLRNVLEGKNQVSIIDFDRIANVIVEVGERIHKSGVPFSDIIT